MVWRSCRRFASQFKTDIAVGPSHRGECDGLIRELNRQKAIFWPRSKLRAHVRTLGLSDDWVEVIVKAYETSIGRTEIEQTDTGEALYVVPIRSNGIGPLIASLQEQRLSITQLLFASVFVALVFSVIRATPYDWLHGHLPTTRCNGSKWVF